MNNWARFERALRTMAPSIADGVEALYGPPSGLSGHPAFDTAHHSKPKEKGWWQSLMETEKDEEPE
jgi:hypothetical protein